MTGEDGQFAFPDSTAGDEVLRVLAPAPFEAWESLRSSSKLTHRNGAVVVMRRFEGNLIELQVTVVDGETGAPVDPGDVGLTRLRGGMAVGMIHEPELALGKIRVPTMQAGRYRLVVRAVDGRRNQRVLEVGNNPIEQIRLPVWRPAAVVCSLDTSLLTPEERSSLGTVAAFLYPSSERSYAVDAKGQPMRVTENTVMFRSGKQVSIRLERVTPNTPLVLRTIGNGMFAECYFVAKPGADAHVSLRLQLAGKVRIQATEGLPSGSLEMEVRDKPGDPWRKIAHWRIEGKTVGKTLGKALRTQRPTGSLHWRPVH